MIAIQRTVDIPPNRRIHLDLEVPEAIPGGQAILTLTFPAGAVKYEKPAGEGRIPIISWLRARREERFRRALMRVAGKFTHVFDEDGVTLQRRWRDEWDDKHV
jgi:hypothetical protein